MISHEYISRYLEKTLKPDEGILLELREYARLNHVPIIQPEVARLLVVLGKLLQPGRILEIGTAIGYSSLLFSTILKGRGVIDTIERNDAMIALARSNIKRAGCDDTINVIAGDAGDVLKCLDRKYDMIFIDAAKGQYGEFFPDCFRMLKEGGLLVSDNVLYKGMVANDELVVRRKKTIVRRMRDYLDSLCSNESLETSIIPIGDGVALSYKRVDRSSFAMDNERQNQE